MCPAELHHPPLTAHARELQMDRLGALEALLAEHDYVLGDDYSLVDLTIASVLGWGMSMGATIDGLPKVAAWMKRCTERPSHREVYGTPPA